MCVENSSTRGHWDEISRDIATYDALYTANTAISRKALKAPGIADWQIKIMIMCESPAGKRQSFVLGCFWPGGVNYLLSCDTWTDLAMQ